MNFRFYRKEEFLVYTVLWTLTCHPYLESATLISEYQSSSLCVANLYSSSMFCISMCPSPLISVSSIIGNKYD